MLLLHNCVKSQDWKWWNSAQQGKWEKRKMIFFGFAWVYTLMFPCLLSGMPFVYSVLSKVDYSFGIPWLPARVSAITRELGRNEECQALAKTTESKSIPYWYSQDFPLPLKFENRYREYALPLATWEYIHLLDKIFSEWKAKSNSTLHTL